MGTTPATNLDVAILQQEINELRAKLAQSSVHYHVSPMVYRQPASFPRFLAIGTLFAIVLAFAWPRIQTQLPMDTKSIPKLQNVVGDFRNNMKLLEDEKKLRNRELRSISEMDHIQRPSPPSP